MSKYYYQLSFADTKDLVCLIKTIHQEGCSKMENVLKRHLSGPYSTLEDVWESAERIYPKTPVRKCEECLL